MTNEERETHLNMTGDDHNQWELFTDDPYWMRRMEKLGIEPIKQVGEGFTYTVLAEQVSFRKGKRKLSEAQRQKLADRMRSMREDVAA